MKEALALNKLRRCPMDCVLIKGTPRKGVSSASAIIHVPVHVHVQVYADTVHWTCGICDRLNGIAVAKLGTVL